MDSKQRKQDCYRKKAKKNSTWHSYPFFDFFLACPSVCWYIVVVEDLLFCLVADRALATANLHLSLQKTITLGKLNLLLSLQLLLLLKHLLLH